MTWRIQKVQIESSRFFHRGGFFSSTRFNIIEIKGGRHGEKRLIAYLFLFAFAFILANCGGNGGDENDSSATIAPSGPPTSGTAQLIAGTGAAGYPQIAMDASGNAIAVWSQSDGTRNNIWAHWFNGDNLRYRKC